MTGRGFGRDLLLPVHAAFAALLGIATVVLFGVPSGSADCCLSIAIFGLVTLIELIAVLTGIAVAGLTGRHSPLAVADSMFTTPLVAVAPSLLRANPESGVTLPLVVTGLLILGLASGILTARVVREHSKERLVLAGALVLLGAFAVAAPIALVVPVLVLAALLWPDPEDSGSRASDPAGATGRPSVRAPTARPTRRRGPPDATAVLGRRASERDEQRDGQPPSAPPTDEPEST